MEKTMALVFARDGVNSRRTDAVELHICIQSIFKFSRLHQQA